jgi:hypothetical protein
LLNGAVVANAGVDGRRSLRIALKHAAALARAR